MSDYTAISIRKNFASLIDKAIASDPRYMNRADFVRDAIIQKLSKNKEEKLRSFIV